MTRKEKIEKGKILYESGYSLTKIGKMLKISRGRLSTELKRKDVNITNRQNRLRVRPNLFESIDNEYDAYWLGFIYADGYISDRGTFELTLKGSDKEHLIKFAQYCNFSGVISDKEINLNGKIYQACKLSFATQHLKNNFLKLGIVPRKTKTLIYPDFIHKGLDHAFIRGYIDGDGSFNYHYDNTHQKDVLQFQFLGTKSMLNTIIKKLGLKKNKFHTKSEDSLCYQVVYGGRKQVLNILHYLYNNSNIYLDRKFQKYLEICRLFEKSNMIISAELSKEAEMLT